MNCFKILGLTFLVIACFSSCKKDDPNALYNASFYTNQASPKLFLYINGNNFGQLPIFSKQPSCDSQNVDGAHPLRVPLKAGSYEIQGKDSAGNTYSSGNVSFKAGGSSTSGNIGGFGVFNDGNCLVFGISK